jgi:hypothetical protein
MLGTVPLNKDVYGDWIASKNEAPPEAMAEIETVVESDEKGKTGFHRDENGNPFIYNYVLKGFLKSACGMMARVDGSLSSKVKAYKKVIDGLVFVMERRIPIMVNGEIGELQRPLRAQTAQGERVALAVSETVPEGSTLEFRLEVLADKVVTEELLHELFGYGKYMALGQWRSGGYGQFLYSMEIIE